MVARYISRGRANPAWKVGSGMSALDQAAYLGHVRIAELLLDNGWDLEARNDLGGRPLHVTLLRYCKELPCADDPVPGGQGSDAGLSGQSEGYTAPPRCR